MYRVTIDLESQDDLQIIDSLFNDAMVKSCEGAMDAIMKGGAHENHMVAFFEAKKAEYRNLRERMIITKVYYNT